MLCNVISEIVIVETHTILYRRSGVSLLGTGPLALMEMPRDVFPFSLTFKLIRCQCTWHGGRTPNCEMELKAANARLLS